MSLRIAQRQTTYWDFSGPEGTTRVHFVDKQEHSFVSPACESFRVVSEHPVLVDYRDPWISIYLASSPSQPDLALEDLAGTVSSAAGPWRSPSVYFNDQMDPLELLRRGSGLFAQAPQTVAKRLCHALGQLGATYTTLPSHSGAWPMQALIAGPNFVVARDFRAERA